MYYTEFLSLLDKITTSFHSQRFSYEHTHLTTFRMVVCQLQDSFKIKSAIDGHMYSRLLFHNINYTVREIQLSEYTTSLCRIPD